MKIFLDTADVAEIREYAASGLVDGVTTNPSLAAKTGRDYVESLKEICAVVPGAVSAEVLATDYDGMMKEAAVLTKIAKNIAREGAADLGRAEGLRRAVRSRHHGQCHAVLLAGAGDDGGQGGREFHFALHRPGR